MDSLRKTTLGLAASLLFTVLLVFGLTFGLLRVFGTPDSLKDALKDSGFYQNVVGNVLDQTQKEQPANSNDQIPVSDPRVQNVIKTAASPELLQQQSEQALDSVYAWLQGKTPTLSFKIDAVDIKARLADGIEQYATEHLASLPTCAPGATPSDVDPFNATCLPQGMNAAQAAAEAKNQILAGEFLKDPTITAENLKGDNGKTLDQQLAAGPKAYKALTWAVYGAGILAALLTVAVVFLSANRRSGLKKVSITFIVVGAVTAILGWLASFGASKAMEFAKEPLQQSGIKVAQFLAGDLRGWWIGYGVTLVVIGVGALLALYFTKPRDAGEPKEDRAEKQPESSGEESTATEPVEKPNPRPVKKLVQ